MTFPNIPDATAELALQYVAGEGASRAALYSARQQVEQVIKALQQAHKELNPQPDGDSEPCTNQPAHSYDAVPKLEREAGGDKAGTWLHDHAMCDPDRDCGPSIEGVPSAAERTFTIRPRGWGKTTEAARQIQEHLDSELFSMAQHRRQEKPRLASFFKDTSPAAAAEQAAMQRLNAASELREKLRMTPDEAMRPALEIIDAIRTSLPVPPTLHTKLFSAPGVPVFPTPHDDVDPRMAVPFPGGRMWSRAQEDAGLLRLMDDVATGPADVVDGGMHDGLPLTAFRYGPEDENEGAWDCEHTRPQPGDTVLGMPAAPSRTDPEDKLRILADVVNAQAPLGSDLANFRRRLLAILDMR